MSSSRASSSPADMLLAACWRGDLPSIEAAVAAGARVTGEEQACAVTSRPSPTAVHRPAVLPLAAAVAWKHYAVVVWLLANGADPNGEDVLYRAARWSTAGILQVLIDAGGDVNLAVSGAPPLVWAVGDNREDNVRVLLAQPCLACSVTCDGETPEQYARESGSPDIADLIAAEVSGSVHRHLVWVPMCGSALELSANAPGVTLRCWCRCGCAGHETSSVGTSPMRHVLHITRV